MRSRRGIRARPASSDRAPLRAGSGLTPHFEFHDPSLDRPVGDVVVRNWGALIGLIGAMLIYAARKPLLRPLALAVAGTSKAIFIALVLSHGESFLGYRLPRILADVSALVAGGYGQIFRK